MDAEDKSVEVDFEWVKNLVSDGKVREHDLKAAESPPGDDTKVELSDWHEDPRFLETFLEEFHDGSNQESLLSVFSSHQGEPPRTMLEKSLSERLLSKDDMFSEQEKSDIVPRSQVESQPESEPTRAIQDPTIGGQSDLKVGLLSDKIDEVLTNHGAGDLTPTKEKSQNCL